VKPVSPYRQANPHLGAHFGIITSGFVSLVIVLAMFEQLGWPHSLLGEAMILIPVLLYLAIALATRTFDIRDYFVSGRRVPPVYNGAVLAAVLVGGTGFFAYAGTLFFLGFDGLAIGLGWAAGLLAGGLLFVPYLRKAGAYTVPAFLGQRFRSRAIRVAASLLQLPPTALLLAAEIKIAAVIAVLFLPVSYGLAVAGIAVVITIITLAGGMRSLTWSSAAEFIVASVGLAIPLIAVSVMLTTLPAPQFTYAELLGPLQRAEIVAGISPATPADAALPFPGEQPQASTKPFLQPFGAVGMTDFVTLFLCLTLGAAALPSLLARSGVTSSVPDQRRSVAWAVLFVALFAATAPALAAFARFLVFQEINQAPASALSAWLSELSAYRLLAGQDINGDGAIAGAELLIARDGVPILLSMVAELPFVLTALIAIAGLSLAIAAAASHLFTLAGSLAEDVAGVVDPQRVALPRLVAVWVAIAATALSAAVFLAFADFDILQAVVTAFAFSAATFFPTLLLAIWWRRCTWLGAALALGLGFGTMCLELMLGGSLGSSNVHVTMVLAALLGATLGVIGGLIGSRFGPQATAQEQAYFEELREPGGEALYERVQRRVVAAKDQTSPA
jgi:cation/acetate symporter